jgi:hypothetical protein
MSYRVQVPEGVPLQFPDQCPFTEAHAPTGAVRLKVVSTNWILPLPGFVANSYTTTIIRVPASRKVAMMAFGSELMIWISLLGGMALCVWSMDKGSDREQSFSFLFVIGGVLAALVFRIVRACILRGVRVKTPWNGFVEVLFKSETFAREFAERNRLAISGD